MSEGFDQISRQVCIGNKAEIGNELKSYKMKIWYQYSGMIGTAVELNPLKAYNIPKIKKYICSDIFTKRG